MLKTPDSKASVQFANWRPFVALLSVWLATFFFASSVGTAAGSVLTTFFSPSAWVWIGEYLPLMSACDGSVRMTPA